LVWHYRTERIIGTARLHSEKSSLRPMGAHFRIPAAHGSLPYAYQLSIDAGSQMRTSRAIFFFSSRRRHTRFSRDWSSDVCSSDLVSLSHTGRKRRISTTSEM